MAKFNIISQFLKDFSFESPNVPELFFKNDNGQAKLEINSYLTLNFNLSFYHSYLPRLPQASSLTPARVVLTFRLRAFPL